VGAYLKDLVERIVSSTAHTDRFILGLTGPPASGKSTLAHQLVDSLNMDGNDRAIVLPMDGYHLSNERLQELGILSLKGIPQSFDALTFVKLLESVKSDPKKIHYAPEFRREIEASIEDAIEIKAHHEIIVVEGNYLLWEKEPWNNLPEYLDEVWYLSLNESTRLDRLLKRHVANGRTEVEAREKIASTDDPNARLIEATKERADLVVTVD